MTLSAQDHTSPLILGLIFLRSRLNEIISAASRFWRVGAKFL